MERAGQVVADFAAMIARTFVLSNLQTGAASATRSSASKPGTPPWHVSRGRLDAGSSSPATGARSSLRSRSGFKVPYAASPFYRTHIVPGILLPPDARDSDQLAARLTHPAQPTS